MKLVPRGLRVRSALGFAVLALLVSAMLSVVTYQLARWYLIGQREDLAVRQTMVNAQVAKGLVASTEDPETLLASLRSVSNARAVLSVNGSWYATVVEFNEAVIPASERDEVAESGAAMQRVTVNGAPYLVIGVELPGLDAVYFEFVSLAEYRDTMDTMATTLFIGAGVATLGGAIVGWLLSRRVLRPLAGVADAAAAIASGELDRRLDGAHDPDLQPVVDSFNEMASSLESRIAREVRFTSDVSHELRTPLTAMLSAVSLARRSEMNERTKFAVDVLGDQVEHLRRLTLELLEISRIDAGVAELELTEVDVPVLVARVMAEAGMPANRLRSRLGTLRRHPMDPLRIERVLANLLENAERYGGGATAVELERDGTTLVVHVDDAGPGVEPDERVAIFGRFHRGGSAQPEDKPKGTGLGLALVEEHVRLHGGTVTVTDSPWGGARFTVRLPGEQAP